MLILKYNEKEADLPVFSSSHNYHIIHNGSEKFDTVVSDVKLRMFLEPTGSASGTWFSGGMGRAKGGAWWRNISREEIRMSLKILETVVIVGKRAVVVGIRICVVSTDGAGGHPPHRCDDVSLTRSRSCNRQSMIINQ